MKNLALILGTIVFALAANAHNTVVTFIGPVIHDKITLYDYDSGEPLDSAIVIDNTAVFDNSRISPRVVLLKDDKGLSTIFLLDNSDISVEVASEKIPGGIRHNFSHKGGLNDSLVAISHHLNELHKSLEDSNSFHTSYSDEICSVISNNINNPIGYYLLLSGYAQRITPTLIDSLLELNPKLKYYNKIQAALAKLKGLNSTQPGNKFVDFEVSYNGATHRLSDIVGHGDYVLLDFWASWCMPCRHEMPYIKKAFDRFTGKNLKIISVAVSDTPEDSLTAAAEMDISWSVWVNGGNDIMTSYGFDAIPLLILFGPKGTILERGESLRGENISETLSKYLSDGQ